MLKSSFNAGTFWHFAIAFFLVWPAIILFSGPFLVHQLTSVSDQCSYKRVSLFNAIYQADSIQNTAFVVGRTGFVQGLKTEWGEARINRVAGTVKVLYVETGTLNIPAAAKMLQYLGKQQAGALILESHPGVWTDFEAQNTRQQQYLELLESEISVNRLYTIIRAIYSILQRDCEARSIDKLPPNLYSASFIYRYDSIYPESKKILAEHSREFPLFWVNDADYYTNRLLGSADTLDDLRGLPESLPVEIGTFIAR